MRRRASRRCCTWSLRLWLIRGQEGAGGRSIASKGIPSRDWHNQISRSHCLDNDGSEVDMVHVTRRQDARGAFLSGLIQRIPTHQQLHTVLPQPSHKMKRERKGSRARFAKPYLPPNQLEMPLFAFAAPSSTFRSNWSTFFRVLARASFACASTSALALLSSLCVLATCEAGKVRSVNGSFQE